MKTVEKSQSLSVEQILPQHVVENNHAFVKFMQAYYDFLEQKGNANNVLHIMGSLHDQPIENSTQEKFLNDLYELYMDEYATSYPYGIALRRDIFLKSIRAVLKSKGSIDSIKTFFREVYNEDVEVVFPEDRRLTYDSKSKYLIRTIIGTNLILGSIDTQTDRFARLVGQYISGELGAAALVQRVTHKDIRIPIDGNLTEFRIIDIEITNLLNEEFVMGEYVDFRLSETESLVFKIGGIVTDYIIKNPGTNYTTGDQIIISDGTETMLAQAHIREVGINGEIIKIEITEPGFGYGSMVTANIVASHGTGAEIIFIGGGSSTFEIGNPDVEYINSNKTVIGNVTQENSYIVNQNEYIAFGYYEDLAGSRNPIDYPKTVLLSSDTRNFGKLYYEMHVDRGDESLANTEIAFGIVSDEFDPKQETLGSGINSWMFEITTAGYPFKHNGIPIGYKHFERVDNDPYVVVRFALDLINNKLYIGSKNGWFGSTDGTLTENPVHPIFENIRYTKYVKVATTGKITPFVKIKSCLQFNDFFFPSDTMLYMPMPKWMGSEFEEETIDLSFVYDYDQLRLPVKTWDEASSTHTMTNDLYKYTSDDYLYRYKIRTDLSAPIWSKVYRACVHPVGTDFGVDIITVSDGTGSATLAPTGVLEPIIQIEHVPVYDIWDRKDVRLEDIFDETGTRGIGNKYLENPTFTYDHDLQVKVVETTLVIKDDGIDMVVPIFDENKEERSTVGMLRDYSGIYVDKGSCSETFIDN